jgi:hypothetical protein
MESRVRPSADVNRGVHGGQPRTMQRSFQGGKEGDRPRAPSAKKAVPPTGAGDEVLVRRAIFVGDFHPRTIFAKSMRVTDAVTALRAILGERTFEDAGHLDGERAVRSRLVKGGNHGPNNRIAVISRVRKPRSGRSRQPDAELHRRMHRVPPGVPERRTDLPGDGRAPCSSGPCPDAARLCPDLQHERRLHAQGLRPSPFHVPGVRRDLPGMRRILR